MKAHRVIRNKLALVYDLYHYQKLPFVAEVLGDEDSLNARRLLAKRYLTKKMINESHLNEQGVLRDEHDPYWRRATYFGVKDKNNPLRLLTTGRFIYPVEEEGLVSLHMNVQALDASWQQWLLREVDPNRVVELASLVKAEVHVPSITTLYLLREMFQFSASNGIDYWVFGLTASLEASFEARFGGAMERMGEQIHVGPLQTPCLPYVLDVKKARERFVTTKSSSWVRRLGTAQIEKFMFAGSEALEHTPTAKPHLAR